MAITLYHGHGSPYSWRAWLALEHKKIPYELKVLSFAAGDTGKPEFIAINPRHQVPTIVDDGLVVSESAVILEYLDDRYPAQDTSTALFPGDIAKRTLIRRLAREADEYLWTDGLYPLAREILFNNEGQDEEAIAKGREALGKELAYFETAMKGDFLAGPLCAADFSLYPFVAYLWRIDIRRPDLKLPDAVGPKLKAWKARIEGLPYFEKTYPPHWRS
jgi:Glutathione S-transferase